MKEKVVCSVDYNLEGTCESLEIFLEISAGKKMLFFIELRILISDI